ncbi:MAG: hypothetical protein PHX72_02035 [Candidatus Shapirobacteria bacterium]|nr:hypothetical protein [Candidatus Shapirobacteria bacterium]
MRKEVVVAIIFGFGLGLLIVGGVWWTNQAGQKTQETSLSDGYQEEDVSGTAQQSSEKQLFLKINYPEEGEIVDSDEIKVSGETVPRAIVVLIYSEGETIVTADNEGDFEGTASLVGGANEIRVVSYDHQGNKEEANLTIVYSTAKL